MHIGVGDLGMHRAVGEMGKSCPPAWAQGKDGTSSRGDDAPTQALSEPRAPSPLGEAKRWQGERRADCALCGRAGVGAHAAGPGQRCLRLPVFFQAARGRGGQRGTSSLSVPAPDNKVPFLLLHSLQLPAQAI